MTDRAPMQQPARRGIYLFKIAGIRINIDHSWFIIFLLVLWSLSAGYFPGVLPGQGVATYWTAGTLATLLFFASILTHELAHSLVAIRSGIAIPSITLFLFGGVSQLQQEPRDPATEFRITIAGPLTSFLLAALFWSLHLLLAPEEPGLLSVVLSYLAWINAALGVFNLLPGYPLDGGRIFRAAVWWKTGSLERATKAAAGAGKGLAVGIMVLGALQIFAGALLGGLWLILIGMFLRSVAAAGYENLVTRRLLESLSVEKAMIADPVSVSPDTTIRDLVDNYFVERGLKACPVIESGKVVGLVAIGDLRSLPKQERDSRSVRDVMREISDSLRISPGTDLADTLQRMISGNHERLLVMEGDRLVGMLTRSGLKRQLEIRQALEAT